MIEWRKHKITGGWFSIEFRETDDDGNVGNWRALTYIERIIKRTTPTDGALAAWAMDEQRSVDPPLTVSRCSMCQREMPEPWIWNHEDWPEASSAASPRCACVNVCGDVPEASDHPNAHCKGLPPKKDPPVELVLGPR